MLRGLCAHVNIHACVSAHVWQTDDNLQEMVLSFHQVSPPDPSQVMFGGKRLNHLLDPDLRFLKGPIVPASSCPFFPLRKWRDIIFVSWFKQNEHFFKKFIFDSNVETLTSCYRFYYL